ncbi:hypothetical protein ACFS7Z_01705 [Pontibacter toksunensis]|uniref:DUF3857 domain-containing protein n=1 Tax=Pontibacter toksunensis TaxID=1332631 RepID=A0ABW6BMV9_9BACT
MVRIALFLPLVFATQAAFAQASVPIGLDAERNLAELGNSTNATMVRTYDNRYEGVKGTPFFSAEWNKATLTKNNTIYRNLDVKYNVYENKINYRTPEGKEFILEPHKIDDFVLTDDKTGHELQFKKLPVLASEDDKLVNRFVAVVYDGAQVQLVMVPEKDFIKANYTGAYSTGNKYDELADVQTYYLIGPGKKAEKVKLNRKNLLRALPDKQNKVQEYALSSKLDLDTADGWAKALAYYESL